MKNKKKAIAVIVTILLIGVTLGILLAATPMAATGPSSIHGFWRLDTGIGSSAIDSSDSMNDGILSGGKFGNALEFDGVDDYVEIPHTTSIDITNQITVEAWINLDTVNTGDSLGGTIIRKGAWPIVDPPPTWGFDIKFGKLRAFIYDEGTSTITNGVTVLSAGIWNAVVFTYDGTKVQIYLNGVPDGSSTSHVGDIDSTNAPIWIGRKDQMDFFGGLIDEVRISNSVRYTGAFTPQTSAFTSDEYTAGLWHFDESVDTTAYDESSNSNDGTINGASWAGPTWVDGKYGKALHFDGEDDYVNIPDSPSLDITGDITMEAWFQIKSFSTSEGYHLYIASKDSTSGRNYGIGVDLTWQNPYKPYFIIFGPGGNKVVWGSSTIVTDRWYHLAGVFDSTNGELMLYLDGILESVETTSISSINAGPADLRIGAREYSSHQCFFNGIIDEVRIWDSALSKCEIKLAMSGKMEILPVAGLVLYDSAIHDLSNGEEVKICIISDYPIDYIKLNPNRPATPKKSKGWIDGDGDGESDERIDPVEDYTITFNVYQGTPPCKTLHLWVYLDTGEHIGVNLHFAR